MKIFPEYDVVQMLGVTPICRITDHEIWTSLVTPTVRAMLGDITSTSGPVLTESTQGQFPQDVVTNLNDHRLYGGKSSDKIRFPYLNTVYRTQWGAIVIKRDGVKFKALGWHGDVDSGQAQLIFKAALRDRRYDGTLRANESALMDWPSDAPSNKPLPKGSSVELSIYGYLPGSTLVEAIGDQEYENFIANPYTFIDKPDTFLKHFNVAWKARRLPGQTSSAIPDVSKLVPPIFEDLARKVGYDFIENAPSHYHVIMWAKMLGYRFTYKKDADAVNGLIEGLKRLKAQGTRLNRVQESWVCVIQALPVDAIPKHLYLGGPQWPQQNIDQTAMWVNKPLHEGANGLVTFPLAE